MNDDQAYDRAVETQQGAYLTTAGGVRLRETDFSLKAGARGPTLLRDHHLDHERIPERVVHARGAAAHGHWAQDRGWQRFGATR